MGPPRGLALLFLGGVQVDAECNLLLSCSSFSPSSLHTSLLHCHSSLPALAHLFGMLGSLKVAGDRAAALARPRTWSRILVLTLALHDSYNLRFLPSSRIAWVTGSPTLAHGCRGLTAGWDSSP